MNLRLPEPCLRARRLLTLRVGTQTEPYWNHGPATRALNRNNTALARLLHIAGRD